MAFIKAHLILLITGVAALAFIVVAALGMMSDSVVKAMQERASLGGQLKMLRSAPRNEESIAAEQSRVARLQSEYQEVSKAAEEINARSPLMAGVFPAPERAALAYDFRDAYRAAVARLPRGKLAGGDLPDQAEIDAAKDEIAELQERWRIEDAEGGQTLPKVQPGPPVPGLAPPAAPAPPGRQAHPGASASAGSGDPSKDPTARARIVKAHNIRCYVTTDSTAPSFGFSVSPLLDSLGEPQPEEMWYAQVMLWIEQDVVAAIAGMNDQAAKQLSSEQAYVENMPVKRLQGVHVLGYCTDKGVVLFPALSRAGSGADLAYGGEAFTGRHCNKDFDVVRFTVVAVVDERGLDQLINAISKQNFYQLINAKYEALGAAAADRAEGYFYGTAPVARVTLDFEGYMARNAYAKWFPPEVRTALGMSGGKAKNVGKPSGRGRPRGRRP